MAERDYSAKVVHPNKRIEVEFAIKDCSIWLRESMGHAELADGTKIAIDNGVGAILVTIFPPGKDKGWRTYVLTVQALGEAVLAAEGITE